MFMLHRCRVSDPHFFQTGKIPADPDPKHWLDATIYLYTKTLPSHPHSVDSVSSNGDTFSIASASLSSSNLVFFHRTDPRRHQLRK